MMPVPIRITDLNLAVVQEHFIQLEEAIQDLNGPLREALAPIMEQLRLVLVGTHQRTEPMIREVK